MPVTRAFHRGAAVALTFKGVRIEWDRPQTQRFQWDMLWDMLRDKSKELTGAQLAAVSKPSRQRRKGPIVRFGSKP